MLSKRAADGVIAVKDFLLNGLPRVLLKMLKGTANEAVYQPL